MQLADTALACHDLAVSLGEHPILRGVDAELGLGETVALLGGNGSGKTTLIRALLGLVPHQGGDVALFGTPAERFHDWHRVGYVPQRSNLQVASATVGEVVNTGRLAHRRPFWPMSATDRRAIARALDAVHMSHRVKSEFATLSGGQQQRVLLARALAGEPELMVLDEPMAGLDVSAQEGLAEVFGKLKDRGMSILIVLHDLGPMEPLLDRSIVLRAGQVIYDGPLRSGSAPNQGDHDHSTRHSRIMRAPSERW